MAFGGEKEAKRLRLIHSGKTETWQVCKVDDCGLLTSETYCIYHRDKIEQARFELSDALSDLD